MNEDVALEAFVRMLEHDEKEGSAEDLAPPGSDYLDPCSIFVKNPQEAHKPRQTSLRGWRRWKFNAPR